MKTLHIERRQDLIVVRLDKARGNAIDPALVEDLVEAGGEAARDDGVRVAVGIQPATLSLSATIAGGATPGPTANNGGIAFASVLWPHHNAASGTILTMLGLLAVGMLWLDGRLKRRHLVALAIALVLAATEVGCGDCSGSLFGCGGSNSGVGSSDQQITAIGATPTTTLTGVPADLGTITSQ